MAKCMICDNEMTEGISCSVNELTGPDGAHPLAPNRGRDRCGDCGVSPGGFHHLGCDLQDCPRCGRQLITCDCPWVEMD